MTHIDEFIDGKEFKGVHSSKEELYARWVFMQFRLPATLRLAFDPFIPKLFCTWKGKRYRVTGASRLGDVWLAKNFNKDVGYDYRVNVDECSEWSDKPKHGDTDGQETPV